MNPGRSQSVLSVSGLHFEARIASGPGIIALCWAEPAGLARRIEAALARGCAGLVSFGTCGGLAPELRPGDWIIGQAVVHEGQRFECDAPWGAALARALPGARSGLVAGVSVPLTTTADKAQAWRDSGALSVDMESQLVARAAQRHRLPFVVCRVVVDPHDRSVPPSALAGVAPSGRTAILPLLRALGEHPADVAGLWQLAGDANRARRALVQGRRALADALLWPTQTNAGRP